MAAVGQAVALRKESVDRNIWLKGEIYWTDMSLSARRAWIEISEASQLIKSSMSLSARRAWIEINVGVMGTAIAPVALRKESVDRNTLFLSFPVVAGSSLSARRAWIEICHSRYCRHWAGVALRKESVDRNTSPRSISCMILTVALRKESVDRNLSFPNCVRRCLVALRKESVDRN